MQKPKIYFFNDTSGTAHAGCRAVMRSLRHHLGEAEIIATHRVGQLRYDKDAMEACEVVFVNGEGSIHHDSPRANFLLDMIAEGQARGKRTLLVNALFQQYEDRHPDVLRRLDFFSVREPFSADHARGFGGQPEVFLDSAADPLFAGDGKGTPLAALGGVVLGGVHPASPHAAVFDGIEAPKLLVNAGALEDIVATLRSVDLYLTGQHHGVYAAGLAGAPFVASPSNSHKIEALVSWSGLPIPICRQPSELPQMMDYARDNRAMFLAFRDFLRAQRVFTAAELTQALSGR